jgi:hypothetical protein
VATEPPIVQILAAATALFLSLLILSAVGRQATKKSFQKRAFLGSVVLLISAVVLNILLTIILNPSSTIDPATAAANLIFSKKVQATIDLVFAISIGAFVLATAKPEIDSWDNFVAHLRQQFPNPFLFYVFVQMLAIAAVWLSSPTIPTPPFPAVTKIEFPLTFLFAAGLAWLTVMTWVPFMLLSYLRRIHARPSVARDVYLIILGVCGYAVTEFVVEVMLPSYAIDGRAPGFILEMALIGLVSFAVRERGFLEDLLVPVAEAELTTAPAYDIKRGLTYLILEESPAHAFEIFQDFVTHGAQGLCITRKAPKLVMEEYGLEKTPILWLSRVATQKNSIRPSPPESVALAVEHFIGVGKDSVVLLDGLEYLIAHNDFQSVLALLHDLNENVSISDAILLVPVDARALSEKEYALLKREVEIILPPGSPRLTPRVELEVAKPARKAH